MEQTERLKKIHLQALKDFKEAWEYDAINRENSKEDLRFVYNIDEGQWDEQIKEDRAKRPTIVINKLRKFVAQVANQERINKIRIKVKPVDSDADPAIAEKLEGLIRNIEYNSQADEIYADSGEKAASSAMGYWRINTRYIEDSFSQEIFIEPIWNIYSVQLDPFARKLDKSDGRFGFIREAIPKTEYERLYPGVPISDFESYSEDQRLWFDEDLVYIAEYFKVEEKEETLYLVFDPSDDSTKVVKGNTKAELESLGLEIQDKRKQVKKTVKWYKLSGLEVLEETTWLGKYIPIIEVIGDRVVYEGKEYKRSLITDAKDPQNMYNYWVSNMTETVALAPKAPYLVSPEMISGYEDQWNQASDQNYFYLLYNAEAGVPQRVDPPNLSPGGMSMLQIADADIKDIIGWYEAGLGDRSNERSGKALEKRKQYSASGTFHFPDNLRRSIVYSGRQLVDLIPHIIDKPTIERIINAKGEEEEVEFNMPDETTDAILNDLTVGRYDVELSTGTWDSLRRQESAQQMIELSQYAPEFGAFVADLIAKRLDWDDSDELNERVEQYKQYLLAKLGAQGGAPATGKPQQEVVQ